MANTVIKRDKKEVEFDESKILKAINKANDSVDEENKLSEDKIQLVVEKVTRFVKKQDKPVSVEEIQNKTEEELVKQKAYFISKNYIKYRFLKEMSRDKYKTLMKGVKEKLLAENIQNQNANVDELSFGGRTGEASDLVAKRYALDYLVSPMARENHLRNEIYIHDLNSYATGCHNCADGRSWVKVKLDGDPRVVQIQDLAKEFGLEGERLVDISKIGVEILSRDGWTKLKTITKRKLGEDEKLYEIKTRTGLPVYLTRGHRLPIKNDEKERVVCVSELKIGDCLLDIENVQLSSEDVNSCFLDLTKIDDEKIDIRVCNLKPLTHYLIYKYGVCLTKLVRDYRKTNKEQRVFENTIKLKEFLWIMEKYPLSIDLISQLRIKSNGSKHDYPLCIPYSKSLAKLYGYIYADGGVYVNEKESTYQLTFTNTNEELIDRFIDCYEDVFGYRMNKQYAKWGSTSPCIRVTDGSRIPVKIFKDFAGARKYGSANISVPDFILNGSDQIKYAFLSAAIDTDGCMSSRGITYTTCGERYSDQIMLLLKSLGYHPVKTTSYAKGTVYRFGTKSGIRNYDYYNVTVGRNDEIYKLQGEIDTLKYNDSYVYRGLENKFNENKIVSIKEKNSKDGFVYDLETESHWFIINNYVSHNCLSIPFDHLLKNGFNTRQTDVRPAQSVNTACQLIAVLFQLQSLQQFGGVAATHFDWTLVPYVRKSFFKHYRDGLQYVEELEEDKIKEKLESIENLCKEELSISSEVYKEYSKAYKYAYKKLLDEIEQSISALFHNLNTLQSRSGNQLPFTSINYGTCTLEEGRLITKFVLETSIKGIGKKKRTSIFPCQIFQCMKGVNRKPGEPNYDLFKLALKSTSLRLYPNFTNCDWAGNAGYDKNDPRTFFSTIDKKTCGIM